MQKNEKGRNSAEQKIAAKEQKVKTPAKTAGFGSLKIKLLAVLVVVIIIAGIYIAFSDTLGGSTSGGASGSSGLGSGIPFNSSGSNGSSGSSAQVVKLGDTISVNYTGTLTNGTIFDASSYHGGSFNFTVGSNVIQGFSQGVIGMSVGETNTITIPANDAYGPVNPALFIRVPTNVLEADLNRTPVIGMPITDGSGQHGVITAVNATNTTVDFNSPLAGQTLIFKITVVKILKNA